MSQELKPCPFCGSKATFKSAVEHGGYWEKVKCAECSFELISFHKGGAREKWNRRSSAPQAQGAGKVWVWKDTDPVGELNGALVTFGDLYPSAKSDMNRQAALTSAQERDMTPEEALAEGRRRGWIDPNIKAEAMSPTTIRYRVSHLTSRGWFEGDSFRAAFASADRAAKEKP